MKLVRYGRNGREKPGLIDSEGKLRDLSPAIETIDQATLSPQGLDRLRSIAPESLPRVKGNPRLGVPFTGISKIVGVGLNYRDHAREAGMPIPSEPILFMKATTCISGPCDPILLPPGSLKTDWEVELAIVIGSVARHVAVDRALDHVAGYCVANDVSEREYQLERGTQWDKGKGCDTFGPLGPWLVRQHLEHGVRLRRAGRLHQPLHDAAARRRHRHRHPARRRPRHEAAALPQGRRHAAPGHRRAGRAGTGCHRFALKIRHGCGKQN